MTKINYVKSIDTNSRYVLNDFRESWMRIHFKTISQELCQFELCTYFFGNVEKEIYYANNFKKILFRNVWQDQDVNEKDMALTKYLKAQA